MKQDNSYITLKDLWENFLNNIWLFVISIVLCVACSVIYIKQTTPVYKRIASLMIKDDASGRSISGDALETMGLVQPKTDINNEMHILYTPMLMTKVVERLSLDYNYALEGRFRNVDLYKNSPFEVKLDSVMVNNLVSFTLKTDGINSYSLSDIVINNVEIDPVDGQFGVPLRFPEGSFTIEKSAVIPSNIADNKYTFSKVDLQSAAENYAFMIFVKLRAADASIVDISTTMSSIQKADDVLNTLIEVYNENWIKDKNEVLLSTTEFINGRLAKIGSELADVDKGISNYKSRNLLPDVVAVAGMNLQSSNENLKEQFAISNELAMAKYVLDYIKGNADDDKLLPANVGLEAASINAQIETYNGQLLKKNALLANSSINNPVVSDMLLELKSLREVLVLSVNEHINTLSLRMASMKKEESTTKRKISQNPEQELYLLSTGREQKIKEQLYLYLLQKREENELSQAFTAYNTKVLGYSRGSNQPVAPQKSIILLVGLVVGCILPIVILVLKSALQTTVNRKEDLDGVSIPFLGSIPALEKKTVKRMAEQDNNVVVSLAGSRDGLNESFRVVRTNLDFILPQEKKCKTILLTSFNPKSGKSFISINLALSMATKDNKVLVIDGDFRRGTLSAVVDRPKVGLVNYLNKSNVDIDKLIKREVFHPMLDVLPMGAVPPNPTELLLKDSFTELLSQLQEQYEYIFFDCPPLEIVSDASIIEKYCDTSIFVARAGLFDKRYLPELEELYEAKKLKNLCLILNDVKYSGHYGYGKYGYGRYGYGKYGYGSYGSYADQ